MIKTLEGLYTNGNIVLEEDVNYRGTAKVLVIFLDELTVNKDVQSKRDFIRKYKGVIKEDDIDIKKLKAEALDEKYGDIT